MGIEVQKLSKQFGNFSVLKDINLKIPGGQLVALLGPSGCGKTTLLRVIAGLEEADSGQIFFSGEDATSRKVKERNVGFVFQHYALFKQMTIFDNIAFGLRMRPKATRPTEEEIRRKVDELLALVQMEWVAERYPSQLSGGQRQRIALVRSLAIEPEVLMLDEPFGALDAQVRKELRGWLRRLHNEMHITSIFVTHDQEEALEVADTIVIMNSGGIQQIGSPEEVYNNPANAFVYNFLGQVNLFHSKVKNGKAYVGNMSFNLTDAEQRAGNSAKVYIRPHQLDIHHEVQGNSLKGRIVHIVPVGPQVKVEVEGEHGEIIDVEITQDRYKQLKLTKGMDIFISPKEMKIFKEDYSI